MISVICCFNNLEKFNSICKPSIEVQKNIIFEIKAIDNTLGKYKSAAVALNCAIISARYDYIVCVHQDFCFLNDNALSEIYTFLKEHDNNCIIGNAGAILNSSAGVIQKLIGRDRKIVSYLDGNRKIRTKQVIEVDSIDECFFAFEKKLWYDHHFDERSCFSWDLYSVELCLYSKTQGGSLFILPIEGKHLSYGHLTTNYYLSLYKLSKKYKNKIKYIATTCAVLRLNNTVLLNVIWLIIVNYVRQIKVHLIKELR